MKKKFLGFTSIVLVFYLSACASMPDLASVTTWYVKSTGRDSNNGISEETAFKTLKKAIRQASKTPVKTITVIGTITGAMVGYTHTLDEEILITGKPDATETERAVIRALSNGVALAPFNCSPIKLEHITLTGDGTLSRYALIHTGDGVQITLGTGAKVINHYSEYGGGVWIIRGGIFIMEGDAEISGNKADYGGGVYLHNSKMIMRDNAVIRNNSASINCGGAALARGSVLEMSGNAAITDNVSDNNAGGVYIGSNNASLVMGDNSSIQNNHASSKGGGVYVETGGIFTQNTGTVSDNTAKEGPDIYK